MRRIFAPLLAALLAGALLLPASAQDTQPAEALADDNGQFITVDGVQLYLLAEGDPADPAVFFLHGFNASSLTFAEVLPVVADAGFYAVAVDRPPFGLADRGETVDYSTAARTARLVGLMDTLDLESAVFVGHSEGGALAAYMLRDYPERVDGAVFIAASIGMQTLADADPSLPTVQEGPVFGPLFALAADVDLDSPLVANMARISASEENTRRILEAIIADDSILTDAYVANYRRAFQVEGWERAITRVYQEGLVIGTDFAPTQLSNADVPILILWGEADRFVHVEVGEALAAALPQADYRSYPEVGHMLPDEAPEQFRDDLLDFLSAHFSTQTTSEGDISPVPAEQLAGENGQFIEADGANLYVIDAGNPDDPAVLLLHGFGGSTFTWRDNIQPLTDAGYRVVAFDRPPYGLADKSTDLDYTNAAYVEQTAALMDILGIESAALVGHSAGGGVIASFALAYPQRVDTLVFVAGAVPVGNLALDRAPTQQQTDAAEQSSPFAALFAVVEQLDPDSPVAVALARQLVTPGLLQDIARNNYYTPETVPDEVLEGYSQVLRVEGWEGALLKLFTSMNDPETLMRDYSGLADFDVPTLIQWGRQDPTVPLIVGEALADFMPNAQLIIYEETGHLPMEEQTEAFNTDLIAFLDSVYTESE